MLTAHLHHPEITVRFRVVARIEQKTSVAGPVPRAAGVRVEFLFFSRAVGGFHKQAEVSTGIENNVLAVWRPDRPPVDGWVRCESNAAVSGEIKHVDIGVFGSGNADASAVGRK